MYYFCVGSNDTLSSTKRKQNIDLFDIYELASWWFSYSLFFPIPYIYVTCTNSFTVHRNLIISVVYYEQNTLSLRNN